MLNNVDGSFGKDRLVTCSRATTRPAPAPVSPSQPPSHLSSVCLPLSLLPCRGPPLQLPAAAARLLLPDQKFALLCSGASPTLASVSLDARLRGRLVC